MKSRLPKLAGTATLVTALLIGAFLAGEDTSAQTALASMSLTPSSQTVNVNNNFSAEIRVNTSSNAVAAVSAYLNFDTTRLQYVSTDYTGSAFDIQAEEVISGNSIKITRGKLPPGVSSTNALVAKVNFKAIASGTAAVSFQFNGAGQGPSRVIKNDGLGTDILGSVAGGSYTVASTTPAPTVTLTANPTTIQSGQSSTLTWSSTNATSCTASGSWTGSKATSGSQSVSPTSNATYTLACTGVGGTVNKSVSVTVTVAPVAPTLTLTAAPTSIISGQSSTLTWSSTNASSCTASAGWTGSKTTSGSQSVAPTTNATYTLACTGAGGSVNKSVSVTVGQPSSTPNASMSLTPASQSTSVNGNFTTEVRLNTGGQQVTAVSAYLTFDNVKLQAVSIDPVGSAFSIAAEELISGNTIRITRGQAVPGVTGSNVLVAKVNFKALSSGTAPVTFQLTAPKSGPSRVILNDGLGTDILNSVSNASYTISGSTTPAAPTLTLAANPTSITSGQSSSLTWSSTNATSCTASGSWTGSKSTSGSQSVSPTSNATYTLSCTGTGGSVNKSASVTVTAATPAPTLTLAATPTSITSGQSSILTWSTTNATSCTASGSWTGSKSTSGSQSVSPTSNATYTLTCTGTGGSVNKSASVTVGAPSSGGNASLSLVPASQTVNVNDNFGVEVRVNTGGNSVTAVSAYLNFDTTRLQFVSIDAAGSAFSVQAEGLVSGSQVRISRGQAAPGVNSTSALVAKVNFKAIANGTANVSFALTTAGQGPSRVIKNDGTGTDILTNTSGGSYTVAGTTTPAAPTLTFTANPTTIQSGQSSTLTWSSTNATSCVASGGWSGSQSTSGNQNAVPVSNTTYTLACTGAGGSVNKSVSVNVGAPTSGGSASMSLIPASQSLQVGQNLTVEIRVNTGGSQTTGVASYLDFDSAKLQYVSIDSTGSSYTITAEETVSGNQVRISRGQAIPGVNSTNALVSKVTFKVLATGTANISFAVTAAGQGPSRVIKNDGIGTDILSSTTGGVYTITSAGIADTVTPTVYVAHSPTSGILSTLSVTLTATATDNVGISSIEIFVDGLSKKICSASPCTYIGTFGAGNHPYYALAKDAAGNTGRDPSGTVTKIFSVTSPSDSPPGSGGTTDSSGRPNNGHLIKYPDNPTVYVIENGVKRPIQSYDIYLKEFGTIPIAVVATSVTYPSGQPFYYGSGALIKIPGSATVYLIIDNGSKYPFKSAEEFLRFGFRFERVRVVDASVLASYPDAPIGNLAYHAKNQFIKFADSPTVYLMENRTKRPIRTPAVFFSYTNSFDDVFTVDRSFNYPDGPLLGFKDGSLIKGSPYTVYLVDSGKKRGFTSAAAFLGIGYSFSQVRTVPDGELGLHQDGSSF